MIDGNNGNDVHNNDAMAVDPARGRPTSTMTPNPATDSPTPMYAVLNGNASTMKVAGTGSLSGIGGGWRYYTISRGPTTAAVGACAASHLQRSTTSTAAAAAATMATMAMAMTRAVRNTSSPTGPPAATCGSASMGRASMGGNWGLIRQRAGPPGRRRRHRRCQFEEHGA